jgi:KDO2-lipid IV(A) lauroyltransferase
MSTGAWLEAAAAAASLRLLGALPPATASRAAGGIAAALGPLLPVSRIADANLARALPELDAAARARILRGVWRSLGQTVGEFPHLPDLCRTDQGPGWEIEGAEVLDAILARGGPTIFFSAHIGNWEVFAPIARAYGVSVPAFYRAAGNARVDALINEIRGRASGAGVVNFAKGAPGARRAAMHLARGGMMAMLVDQKLNDGIEARFFGQPAMTAPAPAAFALRYRCQLVPAHCERLAPARLRMVIEPPLALPDTGNRSADIAALTQCINDTLERWIRARPDAWLWLHRRWPKGLA